MGANSPPYSMICTGVIFNTGVLVSLCGGQPIVVVTAVCLGIYMDLLWPAMKLDVIQAYYRKLCLLPRRWPFGILSLSLFGDFTTIASINFINFLLY